MKWHMTTTMLPRYVTKRKQADGLEHYRFNPPEKFVGITSRVTLGAEKQAAYKKAHEFNTIIDEYVAKMSQSVNNNSTVCELYDEYLLSHDHNMLRDKTKKDYIYALNVMLCSNYMAKRKFKSITTPMCSQMYEEWVKRGVSLANKVVAVSSVLFGYAVQMGYIENNPFKSVKRKSAHKKRIIWTDTEVKTFLNVAYSKFQYRSIGLIVHMAYEWCQRIGDMRLLKWTNINFDNAQLYLEQSKKRREVFLPIEKNLLDMLQKQHNDFGFQEYVAPRPNPINDEYRPYSLQNVSKIAKKVMNDANLRQELQLMHLRATGITEMNEAGVDINQIMSVSGHSNPQSVQPYIKHTFKSANYALTQRNLNKTVDRTEKVW